MRNVTDSDKKKDHKPIAPYTLACRVIETRKVLPDVRMIELKPEADTRLKFHAGQYAQLQFAHFDAKPFSIASAPHHDVLEFHIKSTGHGVSDYVLTQLEKGEEVEVIAPFGDNYLRDDDTPILAVAGGLGMAPLKSIVESALFEKRAAPIHLYYGVDETAELYLFDYFTALDDRHSHFHFHPVVMQGDDLDAPWRAGTVGRIAAEDFTQLRDYQAYLAGPIEMVEEAVPLLMERGLALENMHSDAFQFINTSKLKGES